LIVYFFYFLFGFQAIFRLPRLLKLRSLTDFFRCCDRWVQSFFASVRLVRILALLLYVILSVHVYACIYFLFSNYERRNGVDNGWVYKIEHQPRMSAYSYSFYYCFKIASTIGNIPSPETGLEYVFVIIGYLFALFIFALLIGQIRDVFQSMNQRRLEYQNKVEQVMEYLKKFEIPVTVQDRVRNWFQYNWEDRNTLGMFSVFLTEIIFNIFICYE
jgi:cyclic nucleotide gated channel beta 1